MRTDSAVASRRNASHDDLEATVVVRRIWLVSWAYELLPYFYIVAGLGAIVSSIYVSRWYWMIPFYLIFGGMCVHGGFVVRRLRRQYRAKKLKKPEAGV